MASLGERRLSVLILLDLLDLHFPSAHCQRVERKGVTDGILLKENVENEATVKKVGRTIACSLVEDEVRRARAKESG